MKQLFPTLSRRLLAGLAVAGSLLAARPAAAQWTVQSSNLPIYGGINDFSIVDANVVWATGFDANATTLAPYNSYTRTTNSGTTWTAGTIAAASNQRLAGVGAASGTTAWISANAVASSTSLVGGYLYYTSNGGTTWTRQLSTGFPAASNGYVNGVLAFSTTQAVAVGDPLSTATVFEIYTTADAGTTWTAAATSPTAMSGEYGYSSLVTLPGSTAAATARLCWMGTNKGRVLRSTDSGRNWTAVATGLTAVTTLAFCSATNGIALNASTGAPSTIAYTTDGGVTWQTRTPTGTIYTATVAGVPGQTNTFVSAGFIGSTSGSSYSTDGGANWTALDTGVLHYGVAFLNGTTGWSGGFVLTPGSDGMYKGRLPASALAAAPAQALASVAVYPNPATSTFAVQVPAVSGASQVEARLYNTLGQEVARQAALLPAGGTQLHFETATLATGIYTLRVQAGEASATKQVTIR